MAFIERWLHISPDGGNGASELLILTALAVMIISMVFALLRYIPKDFIEFLELLGRRERSDRFDN